MLGLGAAAVEETNSISSSDASSSSGFSGGAGAALMRLMRPSSFMILVPFATACICRDTRSWSQKKRKGLISLEFDAFK